jgi:hypothetical protein
MHVETDPVWDELKAHYNGGALKNGDVLDICEEIIRREDNAAGRAHVSALVARWHCGRTLLRYRWPGQKKLPNGRMEELTARFNVSPQELRNRMKFAEKFSTRQAFANVVSEFKSWHAITAAGGPLRDTPRGPKPKPHPLLAAISLLEKIDTDTLGPDAMPLVGRAEDLLGRMVAAIARQQQAA